MKDEDIVTDLRVAINKIMIEFLEMDGRPTMDEAIHKTKLKLLKLIDEQVIRELRAFQASGIYDPKDKNEWIPPQQIDSYIKERINQLKRKMKK